MSGTDPRPDGVPLLEASGLDAGYKIGRSDARVVVGNANFAVGPGDRVAVLGANGSGKTTLLKTCVGLIPALGGVSLLGGHPVGRLHPRQRARLVAWVPQISESAWPFTVRELVAQGRYAARGPFSAYTGEDIDAVNAAIERLELEELADRPFRQLSGGEARRVLIARAVAQDTPLVALDEPAAHLDPGRQMELLELLAELAAEGKAIVVSLHDINAARRFAASVLLIDRSGRAHFGPPEDSLRPERLEDAYDTEFLHGHHEGYGRFVLPLARKRKGAPGSPR